ncbi:MAG: redox-sensing transcriptional repressor Rex [Deltaproteobacteria bacterium]|nr:redox-sensing transcriptional repressor Rex [Deltaproteobacteria bacterium]
MTNDGNISGKSPVIPQATMERLPRYLMQLYRFRVTGDINISSQSLGDSLGLKDTQIRKDLSYFGVFGKARYGYNIEFLIDALEKILGLTRRYDLAIVGAGNIGRALANYRGFESRDFRVKMIFDNNRQVIGQDIGGLIVQDISLLEEKLKDAAIDVAIVSVPEKAAYEVADKLVKAGIRAIYNFTAAELHQYEDVFIENANISFGIYKLAHHLSGHWPRKNK